MTRTRPPPPSPPPKKSAQKEVKSVVIEGRTYPISPVLDTLFRWMAERHSIHQKRLAGQPAPWTEDPIFQKHAFTNVFRIYDRVTQYVLHHVVNEGDPDLHETCFRVILFRFFCRISTWELLCSRLGPLTWRGFDRAAYEAVLRDAYEEGTALYGTAYIMPAPALGGGTNYANHLRLLQVMMEEDLPGQLAGLSELSDAYYRIALFPSMGSFLAFQLLLDLNMIPQLSFPEDWAVCGPGAEACLRKIFGPGVAGSYGAALKWLQETQGKHFMRLGIAPRARPRLTPGAPPSLSLIDLEHSLCETEVYSRAAHPRILDKRTVISTRRIFSPSPAPLTCTLPAKWTPASVAMRARARRERTQPAPVDPNDPDPAWVLSHIVQEGEGKGGAPLYQVRYAGYGPEDDLWCNEDELDGARELLDDWRAMKARLAARIAALQAQKAPRPAPARRSSARFTST
ncbi:hypothetical protein BV25DRAFT_1039276 [Artomyces pyxidatus]|uniref:Uncharacterized protein n=1 Tax=Artomyces pyxidatus TaxID=48021 RepID=A0ACB8SVB2_9AGAM|nr:hypothetical protein BV25DRAFT_1039276 [Artomyces pyxidatus]